MIETRVQGVRKMSGKRNKSGQKSPGHVVASAENLAEKEQADRIAAAEAMSCLSSVILLPSEFDKDANVIPPTKSTTRGQKRTRNSQKTVPVNKTCTESKRGKSRNGRGRGARSTNHQRGASVIKHEGNPRDANSMVEGVTNDAREDARLGHATGIKSNIESISQEPVGPIPQGYRVGSAPPRPRQSGVATHQSARPSEVSNNIQSALQLAILSKLTASAREQHQSSGEQLVLKLPLVISNDNTEAKSMKSPTDVVSPASVGSTDSVEFTQSSVEKLLQPPNSNKFDSLDSALPLKKRKLLSYLNSASQDDGASMVTSNAAKLEESADVVDLTTVKVEPEFAQHQQATASLTSASSAPVNMTPVTSATLNPVSVDPRTSLMLLTEMQMALQQDEDGDLPLHIAVAQENIVMVQKFVHLMSISGKSVDKYNKAQQTPLHLAVELDFVDAVKTLLLARANPNLVNKRGENAIHLAVKVQSSDCLKFMIQHWPNKTDLNTRNFEGLAPLHTAVERNNKTVVEMLLQAGADINILDGKSGKTPLFYAVEHNFLTMIQYLLSSCANVDLANYAGITVVMAAQARGYQEAATLLLKGMDSQAYNEIKESTPTKKIPIPRIPSKSHLIVNSEAVNTSNTKNYKFCINNTDSNSSESSARPYQGVIAQRLAEEPMNVGDSLGIKKEMNGDMRLAGYQLINFVPTNLLNGCNQPERMIPQTQSKAEVTIADTLPQISPASSLSSSVTRLDIESMDSPSPPNHSTPVNHITERSQSSQSPKSHIQTTQNQTVAITSQLHESQAPTTTNQVQNIQSHQLSSVLSSMRNQAMHHNFHPYKSPPDLDNSKTGTNNPRPVESLPFTERHSHHLTEASVRSMESSDTGSSKPGEGSLHPSENSVHQSGCLTKAVNQHTIQQREMSQIPVNNTQHLVNNASNPIKISSAPPGTTLVNPLNSSVYPTGNPRDKPTYPKSSSQQQRDSSPYRTNSQKRIVKVNSSGKMHVEKSGSGSKGQNSGSSKGSMPASQMYHLTNISRSTKDILAAKLQGIYTSKANRPLNLSTGGTGADSESVAMKEES